MKNLIIRALTGIIFVFLLVGAIWFGPVTFVILFSIITGAVLWEFEGLLLTSRPDIKRVSHMLAAIYLFIATYFYAHDITSGVIFLPYILYLIGSFIGELYYKADDPIKNWTVKTMGQLYCAGSFSLLNFISVNPVSANSAIEYTPLFILAIFVFIWLDDTGAYLVGSLIGKHRMFERISPKKSWEGFFGGLCISLLGSLIFAWLVPSVVWYNWLGLTLTIVIFGTWGDLVESLLKRTLQVKDSGKFLPGHGGLLDRFDSVILAIPAAYVYIQLFIQS